MFCQNCGKKIEHIVRFCPFCGHELRAERKRSAKKNMQSKSVSLQRKSKNHSKKRMVLVTVLFILIVVGVTSCFFLIQQRIENEYAMKITEAWEFISREKYNDAAEISTVKEKQKEESLQTYYQKLYDEFTENTLEPLYGQATGGKMSVNYKISSAMDISGAGFASVAKPSEALGIITKYQEDLNGDSIPELIVIRASEEDLEAGIYTGVVYIHVYTIENDIIVELPQPLRSMRYNTLQLLESGNFHIFVKEENGQKYICVLNCMRSDVTQLHYIFYVDVFQIEGKQIVCRKSVTNGGSYIYDTTNITFKDDYARQQEERNVIFEELHQSIPYVNSIEQMKNQFLPYFNLGEKFVLEFTDELNGQFKFVARLSGEMVGQIGNEELNWGLIPYDYMYSEGLGQAVELFRLRAEYISDGNNGYTQYWEYF